MNPRDLSRAEWRAYLNYHGPLLEMAYAKFRAAAEDLGREIKAMEAHESTPFLAHKFADDMEEHAKKALAEEVRDFLERTTGPMLSLGDGLTHSIPANSRSE